MIYINKTYTQISYIPKKNKEEKEYIIKIKKNTYSEMLYQISNFLI